MDAVVHTSGDDQTVATFLAGGGEMGALMRATDWANTPLGPLDGWPQSLRTTVSTCLNSRFPILIWWGPDFVKLYNDAYREVIAAKHPHALGRPGREVWPEIWNIIGPMLESVVREGRATWSEDQFLPLERHGFPEETYFTFSYGPIRDESGHVGGVFSAVFETTGRVIGERRLRILQALAADTAAPTAVEVCERAASILASDPSDMPFALLYLLDEGGSTLRLAATTDPALDAAIAPAVVDVRTDRNEVRWPLRRALQSNTMTVDDRSTGSLRAFIVPISASQDSSMGVLVAAISPMLAIDEQYKGFASLVAREIGGSLAHARALEDERRRAEALAEIDRAKTTFFSNVSHEFRTPLTLLLGPVEEALAAQGSLTGDELSTVHRNALRLLKLVNTLLDFARIEAGRAQATFEPTDLGQLTADVASTFRSAMTRAGLTYDVRCVSCDAAIDRDAWEKIVLNLLSNALKFTFQGGVSVTLDCDDHTIELRVRDTGIGIPADELPHVFERFHRVHGVRARTHEGTGIGLALVNELVRMHGGTIAVSSGAGQGATFTVSIPRRSVTHAVQRPLASSAETAARPYVMEALQWLRAAPAGAASESGAVQIGADPMRIVLADDNADMREYVARLLRDRWIVETAADGRQALDLIRARPPALVISDIMMPAVDGFELLRALRSDAATSDIPVILLSARAGEEASIEGLGAGADDYIVKPFSTRELLARVETQMLRARVRAELVRARTDAEAADHAKDQFLAVLGHELRNPLAPILTAVHLLELRGSDDPQLRRLRQTIARQANQMATLVNDLLDVARIMTGKLRLDVGRVDLASVVRQAVEASLPFIESRGHTLDVAVPETPLCFLGDSSRMNQVLCNLLNNAAKYMPNGGRIQLSASAEPDTVVIRVRDEGIGIPAHMVDRVFERFVQAEHPGGTASPGGLGIGLSIVKTIVELHGGSVVARSDGPGTGSEFTVRLPAAPPD